MDPRTEKYVENLSKMIRKETVSHNDQTDRTKFLEFHEILKEIFPNLFAAASTEVFDGSLLIKWKGKNSESEPYLLMNHHDVVEVQGEWSHPAFAAEVADGKLWGRGTLDTKGGLWGMLQAADELAAEGFVPEADIYFESACTEETDGSGMEMIVAELIKRGIHFSMALDEGGMIMYEPISGAKGTFAMVGMGEKGIAELKFIARGNGGHASTPEKDTPLAVLAKFICDVERSHLFKVQLSPVIAEMLTRLAPSVEGPLKPIFSRPGLYKPLLEKIMPTTSATANALMQTTIVFTMAEGSQARNVIPAEASVIANMRVSHHEGYESSLAAVKRVADKYGLETVELLKAIESPLADCSSEGFKMIENAVNSAFDGVVTVPYIMTGASDSRFLAPVCDNCFHFVPFIVSEEQVESIHGIDENVDISTLAPAVDFYKYLIKEFK